MDVLIDKQSKTYEAVSRYSVLSFYYNTLDNKYIYEIGKHLSSDTNYVKHKIEQYDTLDSLSLKYYGRPDLYWVIADFNRILDPYVDLYLEYSSDSINIPTLSSIEFED